MKYLLCSLYNSDTMEYSAPFMSKTRKTAIADFKDRIREACNKSRSFDRTDWSLVLLGDFDVSQGKITVSDLTPLVNGKDVPVDNDDDDDEVF